MFHRIKSVSALEDYKLRVQFSDGVTKNYDAKPLIEKTPLFAKFKNNYAEFAGVGVDVGGYGIVWDDEIDISCDELWKAAH